MDLGTISCLNRSQPTGGQLMTKSIKTLITGGIAASSMFAALAIAQPAPRYTITDLGTLGGTYSYGYGINHAGWVGGGAATASQTGGVAQTAFLWHGGQITNLGTLGGPSSEGGGGDRSEEHTSELQSLRHLVCRLLLE